MNFVFNIPANPVSFVFDILYTTIGGGGSTGGDIEVYLDGVLIDTQTTTDFNTETVNIEWL